MRLDRLMPLVEQWEQVFGDELAVGFVITEDEIPIIERCLAARDRTELDEYVKQALQDGRNY